MKEKSKHIILCIADSLRYDSVYETGIGMPYVEGHATAFTEARSAGCWTLPGTASLFTGLMPHEHGATSQTRAIHKGVPTLAERMKETGFSTHQVTANVVTTDIFGLDRGYDDIRRIWKEVPAKFNRLQQFLVLVGKPRLRKKLFSKDMLMQRMSEDVEMAKTWLQHTYADVFNEVRKITAEADKKGTRAFIFINLMETHFPYHIAPTFSLDSNGIYQKLREVSSLFHHLNQTFLTKGRMNIAPDMLEVLKGRQRKAWKSIAPDLDSFFEEMHQGSGNLLIFASDHGENFGEQGWTYHFSNVTDAGNKIPLFWLAPNADRAKIVDTPVSSRHIHHSILHAAGIPTEGPCIIHSSERARPVMQSYWYNHNGKTQDKYKYNQLCLMVDDHRYLLRNDEWLTAPLVGDYDMPQFLMLDKGTNPIEELALDAEDKAFYQQTIFDFRRFSAGIPF